MYVDVIWKRNEARINKIIEVIINTHRIQFDTSFKTDAQTVFYSNFYKYYDDNDEDYMNFYFICLKNRARKLITDRIKQSRHISTISIGDEERNVFDSLVSDNCNIIDDLTIQDINEYVKKQFDEVEYFVYQQLSEGWNTKDISEMLEVKPAYVTNIIDKIKKEIKKII